MVVSAVEMVAGCGGGGGSGGDGGGGGGGEGDGCVLWQLYETCMVKPLPDGAPVPPESLSPHETIEPSARLAAKA